MRLRFHNRYFILTVILLLTEVLIAVYVHDDFVRPYVGDFLVVVLMYCFIRAFINVPVKLVALSVLLFSFLVEAGQYFHLISLLGLKNSAVAKVVLGNSFAWMDLLMYIAGTICILAAEHVRGNFPLTNKI